MRSALSPRNVAIVVLTAMAVYIVVLVGRSAVDCPNQDDFAFIGQITGSEPITLAWLWEPHNEHRMVLPKLMLVTITRLFGRDFRAVAFTSTIGLILATWLSMMTVARLRGRFAFADALIPLIVLSWAQSDAIIWTSPFNLVCSTVMLLGWWSFAVRESDRALIGAAVLAMCAALTGGNGVAALAGLVPWFLWQALTHRHSRRRCIIAVVSAVALIIYGAVYVAAYARPEGHPAPASLRYSVRFFDNLIAASVTQIDDMQAAVGVGLLILLAYLVVYSRKRLAEPPVLATCLLAVATLAIAAAVTVGRAGFGTLVIPPRYLTLVTPLAVAVLALVGMNDEPGRSRLASALAAVVILSFPHADKRGHAYANAVRARLETARTRLLRGDDPASVAVDEQLYPDPDFAVPLLRDLERVHGSLYR